MQQINAEFDSHFAVLKAMQKYKFNDNYVKKETAESFRSEFYTEHGWKGDNYNIDLSTKEIAAKIREFVKLAFPDCKFSCTCEYYSMGSTIHVALMEAPQAVLIDGHGERKDYIQINTHYIDNEDRLTDYGKSIITAVNSFICSYRYDDSDGMIDYFRTNFYYNVSVGKWDKPFKVVEKTKTKNLDASDSVEVNVSDDDYTIEADTDTRDGSDLWVLKITRKLSRSEYIDVAEKMKSEKGYYSKFKKGFIFRHDPTENVKQLLA